MENAHQTALSSAFLHPVKPGIQTVVGEQFGVRAFFLLVAMSQRDDAVGPLDGRQDGGQ